MNPKALAKLKPIAVLIGLLLITGMASAQLAARFSANIVSGCSPVVVHFSDASTGNPTQWRWELGNGVVSQSQHPSTTYFNPGTYSVKLVIRNASGADSLTKTSYITVYAAPTVAFTASDTAGCFPLPVQFGNASSVAGSTITSWNWDFGDGAGSALPNPLHTYTTAGNFTVTLKVTTANGCTKTLVKTQYIETAPSASADFTYSNVTQCAAPLPVQFTNASTGAGALSYQWSFGDGTSSALQDPSHTYTANGLYTVRLVTITPQGCRDTLVKTNLVNIGISSGFTVPSNICTGTPANFVNTTVPLPVSSTWFFGDGTTSTQMNPAKVYAAPGTYGVKLVNHYNGCTDTIVRAVLVKAQPSTAFTANRTTGCRLPFSVSFSAHANSAIQYRWDFGDGSTGTGASPTHAYTAFGSYTVSLIATNTNGCSDSLKKVDFIKIIEPVVVLDSLPQTGCVPLLVKPSFHAQTTEPIVGYHWDFGNGSSSTLPNPEHVYTTAGNYTVRLTITTQSGCTATAAAQDGVRAGNKPVASFVRNPLDVCASVPVQFTDSSQGNCDSWLWDFGDTHTDTVRNPLHVMDGLGYFTVSLIVWSNTCADTVTIVNAVHVRPPLSNLAIRGNCTDKFHRTYENHSVGDTARLWDFGDGTGSTESNPEHTYSATGSYIVTLTVSNGTCIDINRDTILVIDEKAAFRSSAGSLCKGGLLTLTSEGINPAYIASWDWDFGDGTHSPAPLSANHRYLAAGTYIVRLRIRDLLGCESEKTDTITVYGPTALFSINTPAACLDNNLVRFTDASVSDGTHGLIAWSWNYGDGIIDSSGITPAQHHYSQTGSYTITLKVTDAIGCVDSLVKPSALVISKPVAAFLSPDTLSCTNSPIRFQNLSTGDAPRYTWHFGDGQTDSMDHPVHQYLNTGVYTIGLTVTDQYGCLDSKQLAHYITISDPKASFLVSDSVGTCPPLQVQFTNQSTGFTEWRWDFGDGSSSTLEHPLHFYTTPGTYFAVLTVKGNGGCEDVYRKKIVVHGPTGSFSYDDQPACKPALLQLSGNAANTVSILWDFGDGNTRSGTEDTVTHSYQFAGEYIPKMILTDAAGCRYPVIGTDTIKVIGVEALFSLDQTALCDSGAVNFTNRMVSNDLITSWRWEFDDGGASTDMNPVHRYAGAGTYRARLSVLTATGCVDTTEATTISVFDSPIISIGGDSVACVPATMQVRGIINRGTASNLSWSWNLGNGGESNLQNPASQLYTTDGVYPIQATVTDNHGCGYTTTKAAIVHPLPQTNAGLDAKLCQDNTLQLVATGAARYAWKPAASLSCIDCPNPVASPADTVQYVVTGYSAAGCVRADTVTVSVRKHFTLEAMVRDTICVGSSVQLWAKGADIYNWLPSTGLDNPGSASPKARPSTTTSYQVIATDADHCFTDTATILVKVYPIPVVAIGADVTVAAGSFTELRTSNSADITAWRWSPAATLSCANCPAPKAAPKWTTTYKVQVQNAGGCTASDDVTVSVVCNNGNLFIPNTFSPNGDGANDRFYPRGTGIHNIRSFRVFNRWGEVVYERLNFNANDAAAGWDGKYKGAKAPADVYIYTCEVVCSNNEVLPFKGDITLLQ